MRAAWALAVAAGLFLSACATTPAVKTGPAPVPALRPSLPERPATEAPAATPPAPAPRIAPAPLSSLSGWEQEDHLAALDAFRAGCGAARDPAMRNLCGYARSLRAPDADAARVFFEGNFRAEPVPDTPGATGVLTAYFAPEYEARDRADAQFSAPVRPRPTRSVEMAAPVDSDDAIDALLSRDQPSRRAVRVDLSNADRATIERSPADGALGWMRPEDLFFLQIQGSGVLTFPDGRRMKASYVADNGRPFVAIARPMVAQGLLRGSGASGDAIRDWLASHRGAEADRIMWLNPRYIFFGLSPDDGQEPAGAAGIPLPAGRAIAVDPSRHSYGEVFWIDAEAPVLAGAAKTYRRLAMALDTGSAIRGQVRADLYIGRGAVAGNEAGRVRHNLKMTRLVPVEAVRGSARHEAPAATGGG